MGQTWTDRGFRFGGHRIIVVCPLVCPRYADMLAQRPQSRIAVADPLSPR